MKDTLILESALDCTTMNAGFKFIMDTVCSKASPEDILSVDNLTRARRVGINTDEGVVLGTAKEVYDRCFRSFHE